MSKNIVSITTAIFAVAFIAFVSGPAQAQQAQNDQGKVVYPFDDGDPTILDQDLHGNSKIAPVPKNGRQTGLNQNVVKGPDGRVGVQATDSENFAAALRSALPLTPDQIREFRQHLDAANEATNKPVKKVNPVSRSIDLTLAPGETPPVVRLGFGNASTITFSDATGQPWPVYSVTAGNPNAISATSAGKQGESNIVVVAPKSSYATSNLVVTLVGNPVPIVMSLEDGHKDVDYRLDVKIQKRGPNASYATMSSSLPPTDDRMMIAFLDGVPPEDAKKEQTSSRDVEAWKYKDRLYVRTPYQLYSPAQLAQSTNVSGTNVYVLPEAPVLIVGHNGQMQSVSIGQ